MALSLDPDFVTAVSSVTGALGAQTTSYHNLSSNATYYFKVKADVDTDDFYSARISSVTAPDLPQSVGLFEVNLTSLAVQWAGGNNAAGSSYLAEAAMDGGFTVNAVFSSGTALSSSFKNLIPNTTYFLRVKTVGAGGQDSSFNNFGSTVTLAYPPSNEDYALVYSTALSLFWTGGSNPPDTRYELAASTDGFSTLNYSTVTSGAYYEARGLRPNTTYYFRAAAINGAGRYSGFTVFLPTATAAAAPLANPPGLSGETETSVHARWLINDNPLVTEYYVQASTAADFTGFDYGPGAWFAAASYDVNTLESGRIYHFRVRARNFYGLPSAWLPLGSAATLPGADTTPPSVIDLQGGDDTWRGGSGGLYRVHFSDLGSLLDKFQVKLSTGPRFTGTDLTGWLNAVTGINADTYTEDWALPTAAFDAVQENVPGYVSVRVYDNVGNVTISTDVFYVRRDTTPPNISNNAVSPAAWLASDPGAVFDVDLDDALSGLSQVLYSASNQAGTGNANLLGWTALPGFTPGPSYTAPIGVDFALLTDGVSNYISVRALDAAGQERTLNDVFRILKNAYGPDCGISVPAGAYVSTVTAFTGAAAAKSEASPVAGSQVALQEMTGGLYYDGAAFTAGAPVWLAAQGLASWSYDASTVPFAAGVQYKLLARSLDINASVTKPPYPNALFRLDQQAPSVLLSTPLPASMVYGFDEVSGIAADTGGAGLAATDVYVRSLPDAKWWNFTLNEWGGVPVASAAPAGSPWGFTPGARLRGALAHGRQYFVQAAARDAAVPANTSPFGAAGSTITWIDTVPPEPVAVLTASTGTSPGRIDLAWVFAGDDGGALALTYGQFAVQRSTFSGAVLSTAAAQVLISTGLVLPGATQYYTVSGLVPETSYYLAVWVKDDADQWSGVSPVVMTMSGKNLDNMISGTVKTPAGQGVTGVQVSAISNTGLIASSAYTLDDGNGSYTLADVPDGFFRVQAQWVQDGFTSSIAKDLIPMGYADADFVLSTEYQLASVSGVLPLSRPSGLALSAAGGGRAQLWQGSRLVASAATDAAGRFQIRSLIPGAYTLRVAGEDGQWKNFPLKLLNGQNLEVRPLGTLLKKDAVYAYPNPAAASIRFHIETDIAPVVKQLAVYSLDGALVKLAGDGDGGWTSPAAKTYEFLWTFSAGRPTSGIYFYSVKLKNDLTGENSGVVRKFAVIR